MDGTFPSGIQGLEAVKKIRKFSSVPILMISSEEKINQAGINNGANDYIPIHQLGQSFFRGESKIYSYLKEQKFNSQK